MIRFSLGRSDRARVEAQEAREAFGSFKIPIHGDLKDPAAVERALEDIDRESTVDSQKLETFDPYQQRAKPKWSKNLPENGRILMSMRRR